MDISHITNLLSSLGKNQVTIPIISNDFIETKVDVLYDTIFNYDVFESLDDMNKEIQKYKGNKGKYVKSQKSLCNLSNSNNECNENNTEKQSDTKNNKMVYTNIVHLLAGVNDNVLMFERNMDKVSSIVTSYLANLIKFVTEQHIQNLVVQDKKLRKSHIIQELSNALYNISCLNNTDTLQLLIYVSSKYLMKHIIIYDITGNIFCSEFDYNNNDIEDVVLITKNNNTEYILVDIIKIDVFKTDYVTKNINEIKVQENYKENLKSLSVKDLRIIAKKLCIDIVDAHTGKLYSKVELRLLVEAKINSI